MKAEHNKIRLTTRGWIVVVAMVAIVIASCLYFLQWALITELYPTTTIREDPIVCVDGTHMSYEGTCEPEKVEL